MSDIVFDVAGKDDISELKHRRAHKDSEGKMVIERIIEIAKEAGQILLTAESPNVMEKAGHANFCTETDEKIQAFLIKNDNIYHMYADRIEVLSGTKTMEIPLPIHEFGNTGDLQFYDLYYINNKLFAIIVNRGPYDFRFELDEEKCKLTGRPIPTY